MVIVASKESFLRSIEHPGENLSPLPKDKPKRPMLIVFRHGETYYNRGKLFAGRIDSHLTSRGKKQAAVLAQKLKNIPIDAAIHSPHKRCLDTLRIALKYHPSVLHSAESLIFEKYDKRLIPERSYGRLQRHSKEKLFKEDPKMALLYRRSWDVAPPGGESLKEVWEKRIKPFCKKVTLQARRDNLSIAISCTNNTMRLIRMYFERLSIKKTLEIEDPLGQDYCLYRV